MNFMSRMLSSLFLFAALALALISMYADWLIEQCTLPDQFGNRVSLLDLQRKGEQLALETQTSLERCYSKNTIAESLSRGQMTLIEAAASYRSLYEDPKSWHDPHRPRPDHEDGAAWCREVITWTVEKVHMEQSPEQAKALRQRLETELENRLTYHGTVHLPN